MLDTDRLTMTIEGIQGARFFRPASSADEQEEPSPAYVFLYAFVDYITLLYQQPISVSLWAKAGHAQGSFTSLRERDCSFLGISSPSLHSLQEDNQRRHVVTLKAKGHGQLVLLVEHLFSKHRLIGVTQADLGKVVGPFTQDLIDHLLQVHPRLEPLTQTAPPLTPISEYLRNQFIQPLRSRLTLFFRDLSRLEAFWAESFPGNLFAVVRHQLSGGLRQITPPPASATARRNLTTYNYTASLLLTEDQKKVVEELCSELPAVANLDQAPWQLLEQPLGPSSRSIADTVFDSGIVDFSLPQEREDFQWTRDYPLNEGSEHDILRRRIERVVYKAVNARAESYEIFYIPVSIGLAPWIALYTFSNRLDRESWRRNYYIYRDVRPSMLTKLRELAQQAYGECLATLLREALRSRDPLEQINEQWRAAARYYPFPIAKLTTDAKSQASDLIELPNGALCKLDFENFNPWIRPQIPLGRLQPEIIRQALEETLRIARTIFIQTQVHVLDGVAHDAFNTLAALNSAGLCSLLGDGPIPLSKLSFSLVSDKNGERDRAVEQLLLTSIRTAYFAEEATRGTLALGRILASRGRLLDKFCGSVAFPLAEVIEEACAMVDAYHESASENVSHIILKIPELLPMIKPYYLEKRILRVLIFELLYNHAKHGRARPQVDGERCVKVSVQISTDQEAGEIAIKFISEAPAEGGWFMHQEGITIPRSRRYAVALKDSFLFRFAEISRILDDGLRIETIVLPREDVPTEFIPGPLVPEVQRPSPLPEQAEGVELVYVSQLRLRPLQVIREDGASTSRREPI